MKKAIILSAGQGRRLLPLTEDRPKCLVEVDGRSILEWQLEVLRAAGLEEVAVVVGYRADLVEETLRRRLSGRLPRLVPNPDFARTENVWSCWMARGEMDGPFLLLNGDTLFEPAVLERLLSCPPAPVTVTVNRKASYDADDMKVALEDGRLVRIGKDLPPEEVGAESIGLLRFDEEGASLFRRYLELVAREEDLRRRWYLHLIDLMAREHRVGVCDITGLAWCEIDYPSDLEDARRVVARLREAIGGSVGG